MRFWWTWKILREVIPFSRQYIYELEKAGKFPKRVKFGVRRVAWASDEIEAWIARKQNDTDPQAP